MGFLKQVSVEHSAIAGKGVFAAEFIPAGSCIWELSESNSLRIQPEELSYLEQTLSAEDFAELLMHTFVEPSLLCMLRLTDEERFKNHSESPNTVTRQTSVFALNDIEPGTELTEDYRTFGPFPDFVLDLYDKYGIWTVFKRVAKAV